MSKKKKTDRLFVLREWERKMDAKVRLEVTKNYRALIWMGIALIIVLGIYLTVAFYVTHTV